MEQNDIRNQMAVTQHELNVTTDPNQRKKITDQLTILRYRQQIADLQQKIKSLQQK